MIKVSLYSAHRLTIFNLLMGEMHYIKEVSQHAKPGAHQMEPPSPLIS